MTSATFLEGLMCRTMGKAVYGKLLPIHPWGPIKLVRLPIPSLELWNKRAGFFLLQTHKALLRELQLGSVKCAPVLHLNMPRLLHYFLSDPVGCSDYGPCHHLGFLKLNLSVKPRLAANLCSSHLSLPSGGITDILSHFFNQTPDRDCLPKVMQDSEQRADVSSLPWAFLNVRLKSCQVCC